MSCPDCGKSFPQQHHLTRNVQIDRKGNEKNMAVSSGCFFLSFPLVTYFFSSTDDVQEPVEKVILNIGFGTFERKEKEKVASQFLCNKFSETFENNWNLSKHMKRKHAKNSRQNRTTALCGYIHTIRALKTL